MNLEHMTQLAKEESKTVHLRAVREITRWLNEKKGVNTQRVEERLDYYGDFAYWLHDDDDGNLVLVKAEMRNVYGNFFFETWRDKSRSVRGWMYNKCISKWLAYYFVEDKELWMISMEELRKWAFDRNMLQYYPEKCQTKRLQESDTRGRVVPIHVLQQDLGKHIYKYEL